MKRLDLKIIIHHHDKSIGDAIRAMTLGILIELKITKTKVQCNPKNIPISRQGNIPIVMVDSAVSESVKYSGPETVKILLIKEREEEKYSYLLKRFNHVLKTPIEREHLKQLIQKTFRRGGGNG